MTALADDIRWFDHHFGEQLKLTLDGRGYSPHQLVALASQESGEMWGAMRRKGLAAQEVLRLCCGDTLDAPNRDSNAFPANKEQLLRHPDGAQMFDIARAALVAMAEHVPGYKAVAANPMKFCHGFGVFQRDLQFFEAEPRWFLEREFERLGACLAKVLEELSRARQRAKLSDALILDDDDFAKVAIAYNTGRYNPILGLRQGYREPGGQFYGQSVREALRVAKTAISPS